MRTILLALAFLPSALATLRPLEAEFRPNGNRAAVSYKITPQGELKMHLFFPDGWTGGDRRAAIVFFFGGSCATGSPAQFSSTAEYFASRGMVAAAAEYRIEGIHHTGPRMCVEDGKSAIRWLRMNAPRLGVDRKRVAAGGGSSGASLAAFAAYSTAIRPDDEDDSVSAVPDVLVLINPALGFPDRNPLTPEQASAAAGPLGALLSSWKVTAGGHRGTGGVLHGTRSKRRLLQPQRRRSMADPRAAADRPLPRFTGLSRGYSHRRDATGCYRRITSRATLTGVAFIGRCDGQRRSPGGAGSSLYLRPLCSRRRAGSGAERF